MYVGGILASLLPEKLKQTTGIENIIVGLIDDSSKLNFNDKINIDELTPDYDILNEIEYKYPTNSAYLTSTTKGCSRKCEFCAVPHLEPRYQHRIMISEKIHEIEKKFGSKRNLLLMDNNILASEKFDEIIDEIKSLGFEKDSKFTEPILFEVYLKRLKFEHNNFEKEKLRRKVINEIINLKKRIRSKTILKTYDELMKIFNISVETPEKILFKTLEQFGTVNTFV
jgi:radical SAM superfamily enzyme YgiQ (UPF0313 family)